MNISDQAFGVLYEELEEAFEAATRICEYQKALEIALMMRALEQADLVPHNVEELDEPPTIH